MSNKTQGESRDLVVGDRIHGIIKARADRPVFAVYEVKKIESGIAYAEEIILDDSRKPAAQRFAARSARGIAFPIFTGATVQKHAARSVYEYRTETPELALNYASACLLDKMNREALKNIDLPILKQIDELIKKNKKETNV